MTKNAPSPRSTRPVKISERLRLDLEMRLKAMSQAADIFYMQAQNTHVHPFLEITGLMREMIVLYTEALAAGIDFTDSELRPEPYQLAYIAEKFDCIFGRILAESPKGREAFLKTLEMKGGWTWRSSETPA